MKVIIVIIVIIYLINYINCITVNFNNTLTNQCNNITLPCDLSSSQYWDNPIVDGDDLIIDLTTSNNKNNPYFLIINNFNIQLNSLTLKGQLLSKTSTSSNLNLNLNSFNLNITSNLVISVSNVNFTNSKIIINNLFNTTNSKINFYGQTNVSTQNSNFNNGNLTIVDQSTLNVIQSSVINTYISHTSSVPIILSGNSIITSGINSNGQVSILSDASNNTSIISNQSKYNNFNISSLVVSGQLLFKGDGRNWRIDQNIVEFCNITILNDETLIIIDTSVFTLDGFINGNNVLDGKYFKLDYSSVTINSGFTVQGYFDSSYTSNTILILEGSDTTTFINTNAKYLDVTGSDVSYVFINTTIGEIDTTGEWINITTSSNLESILCVSCSLYIEEYQSLSVLEYVDVTENVIINGTLILANECSLEADNITVSTGGKLFINDDVKVKSIIADSLEITNTTNILSSILITNNGYLTVDSKGVVLKNNITLSYNSTLTINNYYLYDNNTNQKEQENNNKLIGGSAAYNDPIFTVSGSVIFDSINLIISFNEPTNLYNNISIVLLQLNQNSTSSYQLSIDNLDNSNIKLINVANVDDILPKINFVKQDNTIRLEFDNNQQQHSSKWKTAFIVCVVIAGILGAALIIVLIIKSRLNKFNGEYQRLINSNKV